MRYIGLLVAALAVGCVRYDTQPLPPFDPAATFVAHSVHGGLAIDRIPGGTTGRIQGRDAGCHLIDPAPEIASEAACESPISQRIGSRDVITNRPRDAFGLV